MGEGFGEGFGEVKTGREGFGEGFGEGFDQQEPLEPRRARRGDDGFNQLEGPGDDGLDQLAPLVRIQLPRPVRRGDGGSEIAEARASSREPRRLRRGDGEREEMAAVGRPRRRGGRIGREPTDRARSTAGGRTGRAATDRARPLRSDQGTCAAAVSEAACVTKAWA